MLQRSSAFASSSSTLPQTPGIALVEPDAYAERVVKFAAEIFHPHLSNTSRLNKSHKYDQDITQNATPDR